MAKLNHHQLISKYKKAASGNRLTEAIRLLNELVIKEPLNLDWVKLRAECHLRLEHYSEALIDYAKVIEKQPENEDCLVNFGAVLIRCNRYEHAREILEYTIELNPSNIGPYINLSQVYDQLNLPKEQLNVAMKAVQLNPLNAMAYNNLGSVFSALDMKIEAREAYLTAIALDNNLIMAKFNIALINMELGLIEDALLAFEQLLESPKPTQNEKDFIRFNASIAYLKSGQLEKGWLNYEYGFGLTISHKAQRGSGKFPEPKWRGENLSGGSLFVLREQGVGDEILFSNCFVDLEELEGKVVVQCDPRLVKIFQRTYPSIVFIPDEQKHVAFDSLTKYTYISAMGSLPGHFRKTIDDFNRPIKLLQPLPDLVFEFKKRLSPYADKKLIGLAWRTGLLLASRSGDATALSDWGTLLRKPDLQFVSLMWGDGEAEIQEAESKFGIKILRWSDLDLKDDFESVLGLMQNLDAVISVSSTPYALSSFSGVKTFLLTPDLWQLLGQKDYHPWSSFITPIVIERNAHLLSKLETLEKMLDSL